MLGSNLFNLLILALAALLMPRRFEPWKLNHPHTGTMLYGIVLLAIFSAAFLLAGERLNPVPGLRTGWGTLMLPLFYLLFLKREHRLQKHSATAVETDAVKHALAFMPAGRFYSMLCLFCSLIIGGGILLSLLGSRMALPAEQGGFGLEANLIGTLFLAVCTSLPELVIAFSCVRMGLPDMAIGNVLGSNMFNLLIVFAADIALRGGSMLQYASPSHWTSVLMILLLTLLAGWLLRCRNRMEAATVAVIMVAAYVIMLQAMA
jgi:cation:H+ antiporter